MLGRKTHSFAAWKPVLLIIAGYIEGWLRRTDLVMYTAVGGPELTNGTDGRILRALLILFLGFVVVVRVCHHYIEWGSSPYRMLHDARVLRGPWPLFLVLGKRVVRKKLRAHLRRNLAYNHEVRSSFDQKSVNEDARGT